MTPVEPQCLYFTNNGQFPNSRLPLLLYKDIKPDDDQPLDKWAEAKLLANDWLGVWRNGILPYDHYHSTSHEVLYIYAGWVEVRLGGPNGKQFTLQVGDMVVIPAGVAHNNIASSADYAVMGAYPEGRSWDLLRGEPGERPAADHRIGQLPIPQFDPLFGSDGPLVSLWTNKN